MKRIKFKGWVLPSLYAFLFVGAFLVTIGVSNLFMDKEDTTVPEENPNYVTETVIDEEQPVVKQEIKILKPFNSDKVSIGKYYYDYKGTEDNQEKSLTYHDNTYQKLKKTLINKYIRKKFKVNTNQNDLLLDIPDLKPNIEYLKNLIN